MPDKNPPDTFELAAASETGAPRVRWCLAGPSSHGWIYQTEALDACCRVLPIRRSASGKKAGMPRSDDAPIERRYAFTQWIFRPPQDHAQPQKTWLDDPRGWGLAPIVNVSQSQINGSPWLLVRYDISFKHTLAGVANLPDPLMRLECAIQILLRIPTWWSALHVGLVPMPSEIVFNEKREPFLLPSPRWRYPDAKSVFAEPSRGMFLAPEYVRGLVASDSYKSTHTATAIGMDMDRYAFGAALLLCFCTAPHADAADDVLCRCANSSLWTGLKTNLPFWLQRLPAAQEALSALRQMVHPEPYVRSAWEPHELAARLLHARSRLEPRIAVRELLADQRADEAYKLLQDVLLFQNTPDMLMLAGHVASACHRPLEAVDYYEKAIAKEPQQVEAYRCQFEILASDEARSYLEPRIAGRGEAAVKIDEKVYRDFQRIEAEDSGAELLMAGHLLWRQSFGAAQQFIYSRLVDADKQQFHWWKFPLRLLYATLLLDGQRGPEARQEWAAIARHVQYAREQGLISPADAEAHFRALQALDERLTDEGFFSG